MAKRSYFDDEARTGMAAGIDLMARAVRGTLGPRGRRVGLNRRFMQPLFSNDGSSIATEFILEDKLANMGAQLMRKVANQMAEQVGDGTTTTILLSGELVRRGYRQMTGGAEPRSLAAGLRAAAGAASAAIAAVSRPLADLGPGAVRQVAYLATRDGTIADLVAEAWERVGEYGLIEVEPSQSVRNWVEFVPGLTFDEGYLTPRMIPGKDGGTVDLAAPMIMVMDYMVTDGDDLVPALNLVKQRALPLLIVAEEVTGEALSTLIINNVRGITRAFAVRPPGFGGARSRQMLMDLATLTGAKLLGPTEGYRPEHFTEQMLGRAARAVITEKQTQITGGGGTAAAREARAAGLRHELARSRDEYEQETLKRRIGWLTGGVAILRPSAAGTSALRETRYRAEHGLAAVRAARAGGLVTGGGLGYLPGAAAARQTAAVLSERGAADQATGARLLADALYAPLRQLAENAGLDGSQVLYGLEQAPPGHGLDVETMTWGDLWARGIADPTGVVVQSVQKAVSLAALVLESSAVVVDLAPERQLGG